MTIALLRTIILYFVVIASIRLLGKRQVGELQASELVVTLLISDLASVPMQSSGVPLMSGLIPILVLVFLELILSGAMLKSARFRRLFCGSPVILLWNGVIDKSAMKKLRVTVDDLFEQLRQQGVFHLEDVYCAVVETNGKLSVLLRETAQPVTAKMAGLTPEKAEMPLPVISDGLLLKKSMDISGHDRKWLESLLRKKKLKINEIFIMTVDAAGGHHIVTNKEVVE